jgi:hypothetical protein
MRSIHVVVLAAGLVLLHAASAYAQTRSVPGRATGTTGVRPTTRPPAPPSSGVRARPPVSRPLPITGTARGRLIPTGRFVFDPFLRGPRRALHAPPGVFVVLTYPIVYHHGVSTRYVHTQVATTSPLPATEPAAFETCAIVTVLQPGERGYWKRITLPAAGAQNLDELQRVLAARVEEGDAFLVRDALGETLAIPAPAELDRLIVHACEP